MISLRRVPHLRRLDTLRSIPERDTRRPGSRAAGGPCNEIKEEGHAQRGPGDVRGRGHLVLSARAQGLHLRPIALGSMSCGGWRARAMDN